MKEEDIKIYYRSVVVTMAAVVDLVATWSTNLASPSIVFASIQDPEKGKFRGIHIIYNNLIVNKTKANGNEKTEEGGGEVDGWGLMEEYP